MHEDFKRELPPGGPSDRNFGITFAAFFALIGLAPLLKHHPARWWAIAISAGFLLVSAAIPSILRPANRAWMGLAHLLNRIVSPIVMAVVFVVAVLPTGLILRMLGKDPMRVKFDRNAGSYWIARPPSAPESMSRQF